MTALLPSLPPGAIARSSRDGPDRTRRACSAEATSVARGGPPAAACWGADTHLRGWSLLSPLLAAGQRARARIADERERADRAGWELRWAVARVALRSRRGESSARGHGRARQQQQRGGTSGISRQTRAATAGRARGEHARQGGGARSTPATRVAMPRAREHPHSPRLVRWRWVLSSRCARAALARRSRCATRTPASGEPEPWEIHGDGGSSPSSFLPSSCHCVVVTNVVFPISQLHTTTPHHHPAAPSRATRRGVTGATRGRRRRMGRPPRPTGDAPLRTGELARARGLARAGGSRALGGSRARGGSSALGLARALSLSRALSRSRVVMHSLSHCTHTRASGPLRR